MGKIREVFCEKSVLLPQVNNFIKKETLGKMLFCEFCEIFESIYFYRTPLMTAFEIDFFKKVTLDLIQMFYRIKKDQLETFPTVFKISTTKTLKHIFVRQLFQKNKSSLINNHN